MKRTIDEVIEIAQQKFKFHYVQMKPILRNVYLALNICLNSTMFRWNSELEDIDYKYYKVLFKFHYVQMEQSLVMAGLVSLALLFKFHYVQVERDVSVNIYYSFLEFKFHYVQMKLNCVL